MPPEPVTITFIGGPHDGDYDSIMGPCPITLALPTQVKSKGRYRRIEHTYQLTTQREDGIFVFTFAPLLTLLRERDECDPA